MATGTTLANIRAGYMALAEKGEKGEGDYPMAHRDEWSKEANERMAGFMNLIASENLGPTMQQVQDLLFNAPAVAWLTLPKGASRWAVLDLGAFEQSMLLSATNRGLGSIPAYNLAKHPAVLRKFLGVPETEDIVLGIALGYESEDQINKIRTIRELTDRVVTFKD